MVIEGGDLPSVIGIFNGKLRSREFGKESGTKYNVSLWVFMAREWRKNQQGSLAGFFIVCLFVFDGRLADCRKDSTACDQVACSGQYGRR
jgi:hypothetical protein